MATVEGDKIEPHGLLGPRTRRSAAATTETGDMAGGSGEGERDGSLGYVLSLPAAWLPLPVAVSCLDATVPRKARSRLRLRAQPCAWWAFKLPAPAPEETKTPAPPASMATTPTEEEARSPRPQRLRVRQALPPSSPDDPHTPSLAMERPAKRAKRCLQCGAAETPRWRSGPMGSGTLCNACGVRLKAAGALRQQVHRPPPATARTVAEPPPESPVSDSSPDGPIWEPGSVPDVYLLRKKPPKQGKPPRPRMEPAASAPGVYLMKKKKKKPPPKASERKPWRPRKSSKLCLHCGSSSTPQWREGPMGRSTLCNACGVRYRQGRLLPEYRPLASPSFEPSEHANRHSHVLQLHRQRLRNNSQKNQPTLPTEQPQTMDEDDPAGAPVSCGGGDDPMNELLPRRWHNKDEYPPTPLHQPLPQPVGSLAGDPRVGGMDSTAQGRGGGDGSGNDPNDAPSSLDSLLLEGPSAPLIVDGEEPLIE